MDPLGFSTARQRRSRENQSEICPKVSGHAATNQRGPDRPHVHSRQLDEQHREHPVLHVDMAFVKLGSTVEAYAARYPTPTNSVPTFCADVGSLEVKPRRNARASFSLDRLELIA